MLLKEAKRILKNNGYRLIENALEDDDRFMEIKNKRVREYLTVDDKEYLCSIPLFDEYREKILNYMSQSDKYNIKDLDDIAMNDVEKGIRNIWLADNGDEPFIFAHSHSLGDDSDKEYIASRVWYYAKTQERRAAEDKRRERESAEAERVNSERIKMNAEKERLKKEDPSAYFNKYVKNTTNDPDWTGPAGRWSVD